MKIPKVPGRRAIKIATPEQYLKVRACLPTKPARVFSTLLVSSGIRFCEAIGLLPADFDFEEGVLEVARSVVKVSREHHPQGKTFLIRDYTKNGQTRRLKLDRAVVELVRDTSGAWHRRDGGYLPGRTGGAATTDQAAADGGGDPGARQLRTGWRPGLCARDMGGYTQAKCRCAGCRQWARDYGRERMRDRRAGALRRGSAPMEKSRDSDEPYLDEHSWNRIWASAVEESGIPFKPTAYQVRQRTPRG